MRKMYKWLIGISVFLLLANYNRPFRLFFIAFIPSSHILRFSYTTEHADYVNYENMSWKSSRSYAEVAKDFEEYKHCQPTSSDTILYRTFELKPWEFWNWLAYLTHPRYQLPYIDSEVMKLPPDYLFPTLCPDRFPGRPVLNTKLPSSSRTLSR